MAVGGDQPHLVALGLQQQAVEVVTDVLHRHRVLHLRDQALQVALAQAEAGLRSTTGRQQREIVRRQRLQVEAALAGLQHQAAVLLFQRDHAVAGNGAQDVLQLFRRGGQAERVAGDVVRAGGGDLDFQVGRQEADGSCLFFDQHIRQNGQGVAALDDAGDSQQWLEQGIAFGLQNQHVRTPEGLQCRYQMNQLRNIASNVS
ncbi:hypothetical protein D3C78_1276860 [compost metagenome]